VNAPALLLGAALLFWAQQTGLWFAALPMFAVLESPRLFRRRWEVSPEDFHRIGDLSTLLFVALVVYLYLTRDMIRAVATVLAWLPVACFPLIAAQTLSAAGRLDLGALFWSQRRGSAGAPRGSIDVSYPYFALCVLSAGAANVRTPVYYAGTCVLGAWALWRARSRGSSAWVWAGLVAAAAALGFAAQSGLAGLQRSLENAALEAVFGSGVGDADPYRSRTSLGQIGRLQLSGEIALRVSADHPPALLRQASYNLYRNAQWFARDPGFMPLRADGDGAWELVPSAATPRSAVVTAVWPRGTGVLALPLDAARVEGLPAGSAGRNRLGTVEASEAPGVVAYRVLFGAGSARDAAPAAADLELPDAEAGTFRNLSRELGLARLPPRRALDAAAHFFAENFRYSTYQRKTSTEPLQDFLFKTRSGHCEYFATSAVLLLRAAGIPARYAVGYSVQEYSRLERAFVVRQRHAHAWAEAYVDGAWRDFDTTPNTWGEVENARASRLEFLGDAAAWAHLLLAGGRVRLARSGGRGLVAWLALAALAGWIIWKAIGLIRSSREAAGADAPARGVAGADSEFFAVAKRLELAGLGRRPEEAPASWIDRLEAAVGAAKVAPLRPLLALHYRYRFDPLGLSADERETLRRSVAAWLTQNRAGV
jgi:hypothetical protein